MSIQLNKVVKKKRNRKLELKKSMMGWEIGMGGNREGQMMSMWIRGLLFLYYKSKHNER